MSQRGSRSCRKEAADSPPPAATKRSERATRVLPCPPPTGNSRVGLPSRYGPEVLGFIASRLGIERAQDVFQELSIRLWRSWGTFMWTCGARTWVYRIARHAIIDFQRAPSNRPEHNLALSDAGISNMIEEVRSQTMPHLRSSVKNTARLLREKLSADDQELLTLRVDKAMSYREIAIVMGLCSPDDPEADTKRVEARVRQRFTDARKRLTAVAKTEGLVDVDDPLLHER